MLKLLFVLAIAAVAGLVLGFMLGGLAATTTFGPDDEYHRGLFQMVGMVLGLLVGVGSVIARMRKRRRVALDVARRAGVIGSATKLPPDLSTNKDHLDGFGQ